MADGDERRVAHGQRCELCGRMVTRITKHHLIPKTRHRNKRVKRQFDREELHERVAWLCRPCHDNLHRCIENKDLALHYNAIALIVDHPDIQRFTAWIARKPDGFKPKW